ncbi:MAG TPA: ABC transporter permease [Symbiobacteriaceae bacterium]|nr:ABC transporter permease [Symbiobacteriaceae bacterium]
MRRMISIALLQLRTTFKSKGAMITMFGMPLILTLIFGGLMSGAGGSASDSHVYPIVVVDHDGSFAARQLISQLDAEATISVQTATAEEMKKLFADVKVDSGVVIPAAFGADLAAGKAPDVQLLAVPGRNTYMGVGPTIRGLIARLGQDYQLALRTLPEADRSDAAKVEAAFAKVVAERKNVSTTVTSHAVTRTVVEKTGFTAATGASVGFTVTFVMMQCFMMSGVILTERKHGTWGRLLTTPNSRVTIMGGYLLSFFLTGMIQFTVLVVATRFLFQVSWGPMLPLFAMGAGTVLSASGMGLFLAGIVKTFEQQMSIGILFINATAMLGGAYWDLSMVSDTMRRIGYMTPQAWAIDGFREVMLRGGAWEGIALPLAVLLGITAVFMTAGLLRVRYE